MALTASWVHGNNAVPQWVGGTSVTSPGTPPHLTQQPFRQPWTDIVGLPQGPGKIFRGQPGDNYFHFTIPTPVILNDVRVSLLRVFVLSRVDAAAGVHIEDVVVFDGPNNIFSALAVGATGGRSLGGEGGLADLVEGANMWTLPKPPQILWGIGISAHVVFPREGNITFTAAGADFLS